MKCFHRVWTMAIAVATMALMAASPAPLYADEPTSIAPSELPVLNGIAVPEPQPRISTLEWLDANQRYFNTDRSAYWNAYYRGGKGQLGLTAIDYLSFNYNNRTDEAEPGNLVEFHHMLQLAGSPFPGVRLFAGAGLNTLQIDRGNDDEYDNFIGLTFDLGIDIGLSLHERLVLELGVRYRQYQADRGDTGVGNFETMQGQWYRAQAAAAFEILKSRATASWSVYAGAGMNIVRQTWDFTDGRQKLTPNNIDSLNSGESALDIFAGTNVILRDALNLNLEARFVGPFSLAFTVAFLI